MNSILTPKQVFTSGDHNPGRSGTPERSSERQNRGQPVAADGGDSNMLQMIDFTAVWACRRAGGRSAEPKRHPTGSVGVLH
jgi:hypothetical protein